MLVWNKICKNGKFLKIFFNSNLLRIKKWCKNCGNIELLRYPWTAFHLVKIENPDLWNFAGMGIPIPANLSHQSSSRSLCIYTWFFMLSMKVHISNVAVPVAMMGFGLAWYIDVHTCIGSDLSLWWRKSVQGIPYPLNNLVFNPCLQYLHIQSWLYLHLSIP